MAKQGLALDLSTLDLCFVAALHLKAEGAALASFEQDQLVDVFEQVCAAIEPDSEAVRTRATHAIRRLREQRLLARIDGAGVVRAGEYALTRLATGIVEFFLHEESLTRESLAVLIRSLLGSLNEVRKAASASKGLDAAGWRAQVVLPLRVTIGDLVSGIERRQRGFDVQQEQLQRDIAHLLEGDWFGVVERCQTLLEQTGATLSELYQVLLRDTHEVQHVLQDIEELCAAAAMGDAEQAARTLMEQNDRIAAWGSNRQRACRILRVRAPVSSRRRAARPDAHPDSAPARAARGQAGALVCTDGRGGAVDPSAAPREPAQGRTARAPAAQAARPGTHPRARRGSAREARGASA